MSVVQLDQLVREVHDDLLADPRGPRVVERVSRYARAHVDWREFAFFDPTAYTRNLVYKDELFEMILLCWDVGQVTPIHNHQGQRCWMGVLDGQVEETLYAFPGPRSSPPTAKNSKQHVRGEVAFITDEIALHRIAQVGPARAVSLHLYSRPIPQCSVYDPTTGAITERQLAYHSVRGVRLESTKSAS